MIYWIGGGLLTLVVLITLCFGPALGFFALVVICAVAYGLARLTTREMTGKWR